MGEPIRKLFKEPLLHFLLLGAVLFIAYNFLSKRVSNEPGKIIVTQGQITAMTDAFIRTRQRQPTSEELEGLIKDKIREEVYYREALALGLDKDDIIIRRRLRQKMEFIANDVSVQAEPSDADLLEFMTKHPEQFLAEPNLTFRQVFLNPVQHGNALKKDISEYLSELNKSNSKADYRKMGDASLLPSEMVNVKATEVSHQYGEEFTKQLMKAPKSHWTGPVSSAFGIHLVWVGEKTEGGMPALNDIHDAVRLEWDNARRLEADEKFYQELLKNYTVAIEPPVKVKKNDVSMTSKLVR